MMKHILLIICSISRVLVVNGFVTAPVFSTITLRQYPSWCDIVLSKNPIRNPCYGLHTISFLKKLSNQDVETAKSVTKQLWFLPVISLLSGLTPACRIIGENHISRLPDCPIAHDMDTRLLWPAVASSERGLPPSVFTTPAAAITNENSYAVDWNLVWNAYISRVELVAGFSFLLTLGLIGFLIIEEKDETALHEEAEISTTREW